MAFAWVRPQQEFDLDIEPFSPESDEAENDTGRVLDERYELREAIAWGGTAAVYRAFDRRVRSFVVVKVLCSGLREQIGAYFDQEGRVAAAISNPHLVRAHDRGLGEPPYIVFDLVPGRPLSQIYFERPMPWRELCAVMLPVLDALEALHQEGIVHRDLKPENVLVQPRIGRESRVALLDVGFAAVPPGRLTNAPAPSETVYGTAGYIAPEYFAGHLPDPRCDLFSVGALMYAMLTTQSVRDMRDLGEVLAIPPPRVIAPGVEIPEAVEDIVMRALSDIEARFQSAREMAEAIQAALAPAPLERTVPVPVERVVERVVMVPSSPARWWTAPLMLVAGVGLGVAGTFGMMSLRTGEDVGGLASEVPAAARGELLGLFPAPGEHATAAVAEVATPAVETPPTAMVAHEALSPAAETTPGGEEPGTSTLSAVSPAKRSSAAATRARGAAAPRATATFAGAMAAIEPKVQACAEKHAVPIEPVMVKVRGAGGAVDSVRVLGMSSQHPFSQCVDRLVRDVRPPLDGALVEAFEFFRKA